MSAPSVSITFGGEPLQVNTLKTTAGAYGSVGSASVTTSRAALTAAGIDVVKASVDSTVGIELAVSVTEDGETTKIFGGEYVNSDWSFDTDTVILKARDWAGVLVDQKRVLTSLIPGISTVLAPGQVESSEGVDTQNKTVTQIVTAIATQFGMKPVINLPDGDDLDLGTVYGSDDTVFMPVPQSLWAILNYIARATGNEVYVSPNKELVFGTPGAGADSLLFSWKVNPPPDGYRAIRDLRITHNPRRNQSFRVLVLSYDPAAGELTQGNAFVLGTSTTSSEEQTVNPGLWVGQDASNISTSLAANSIQFPLYSFHVDGLTQAQADARAEAIAIDIAKRELIVTGQSDIIREIIPMNHMRLTGSINDEFTSHDYYINGYTHTFELPTRNSRGGLWTQINALDIQLQGKGSAVTKKARTR